MRKFLAAVVMALVASTAVAMPLDLDNPSGIVAIYAGGDEGNARGIYVVCIDGTGNWTAGGQTWMAFTPSPVPLSEIADWTPWVIRTTDGRWFWRLDTTNDQVAPWEQAGVDTLTPSCNSPIKTDQAPLGKVKSLYR